MTRVKRADVTRGAERIDLIDEDDGGTTLASKHKQLLHETSALSLPLGDEIRRGDGEEGARTLGGNSLGQVRLTRSGRAKEENSRPRLALSHKDLGMDNGENRCRTELFLGSVQSGHVFPLHVWFFVHDHAEELSSQLRVGIFVGVLKLGLGFLTCGLNEAEWILSFFLIVSARSRYSIQRCLVFFTT